MSATYYSDELVTLHHGDCLDVLRTLPDASVDAVVTDPPYGLEFMGREWDGADGFRRSLNAADVGRDDPFGRASRTSPEYRAGSTFQSWCEAWATECLRVLKPGGHLLAFGGSRTWHRLACAIEDAGFEMRDSIAWLYGSGFPKSLDVSKAIDKGEGHWRGRAGEVESGNGSMGGPNYERTPKGDPVTAAAAAWRGWGTALKPAFEPIVVARKPLAGTVAANVLAHGTGALNIDATRTATSDSLGGGAQTGSGLTSKSDGWARPWMDDADARAAHAGRVSGNVAHAESLGRWPTNVVLDDTQAAELDRQSGVRRSAGDYPSDAETAGMFGDRKQGGLYADSGGASRFFPTFRYEAKAPTVERPRIGGVAHPTVKPLDLMRWLVRLVTPPGGVVLEPFAGSGTTAEACVIEGFRCIAIEREADYLPLIVQRLTKPIAPVLDLDGVTA